MIKLFAVLKKDLRLLLRDRGQLMTLFLTPLAFIIPISLAFPKDGYVRGSNVKPPLPVVSYDLVAGAEGAKAANGDHARELIDFLAETFDIDTDFAAAGQVLGLANDAACQEAGPACDELIATTLVARSQRNTAAFASRSCNT